MGEREEKESQLTAGQLIEWLQRFDQKALVFVEGCDCVLMGGSVEEMDPGRYPKNQIVIRNTRGGGLA